MPQDLLAYFSDDFTDADVKALEALAHRLIDDRWTRSPPQFVDEVDDSSCSYPEDQPIRTVGLVLSVSSTGEQPETPVAEARRMIDALATFSRLHGVEFELQIGQTHVGDIADGIADEDIRKGLLEVW